MNKEDEDEIDYGGLEDMKLEYEKEEDQNDKYFEQLWVEQEKNEHDLETELANKKRVPTSYLLDNNTSKHKQLIRILAFYYVAKHSEPLLDELFPSDNQNYIKFDLN